MRFLTTGIVSSEMSYAAVGSLQQQALFSIALVLFLFIMLINAVLNFFIKKRKGGLTWNGTLSPRRRAYDLAACSALV